MTRINLNFPVSLQTSLITKAYSGADSENIQFYIAIIRDVARTYNVGTRAYGNPWYCHDLFLIERYIDTMTNFIQNMAQVVELLVLFTLVKPEVTGRFPVFPTNLGLYV